MGRSRKPNNALLNYGLRTYFYQEGHLSAILGPSCDILSMKRIAKRKRIILIILHILAAQGLLMLKQKQFKKRERGRVLIIQQKFRKFEFFYCAPLALCMVSIQERVIVAPIWYLVLCTVSKQRLAVVVKKIVSTAKPGRTPLITSG